MSEKELASVAGAAELRGLLEELGQAQPQPRSEHDEAERAQRMAASIDGQVETLVAESRTARVRWLWGAAAAVVVLALGAKLWSGRERLPFAHISREPVPVGTVTPKALETSPAPVALPPLPSVKPTPAHVPSAAVPPAVPPPVAPTGANVAPAPSAAVPAEAGNPGSTLGEENRLFKEAAEASRQGDVSRALGRLDELLSQHPGSPLAQTAQVRKFRLLIGAGRSDEARREAARYLANYPTGFAVAEAMALQAPSSKAPPAEPSSSAEPSKTQEPNH